MANVRLVKVFDTILADGIRKNQIPARGIHAREWFRKRARGLSIGGMRVTPDKMKAQLQDRRKSPHQIMTGKMYFFSYDPKWKDKLPYYDTFPLIFVISQGPDRMLGINLHYLPFRYRAMLMDALYSLVTDERYDEKTKLVLSYNILKSASKFKWFQPCIKEYLYSHLRSELFLIQSVEWDIAMFLPVARFKKKSQFYVWQESVKKVK